MARKQKLFAEVGQEFGRLTVVELGKHPKSNRPAALVECKGSAENPHDPVTKWMTVFHLVSGSQVRSCGCLQREKVQEIRSDSPGAVRQREWRERRASPDYQPVHHWHQDEDGRECSYSGRGNCGHQYKPWSAYSEGETRCKSCMAAKQAEYMEDEPDEVKLRRAERQRNYQKTAAGKEAARKAKLKYHYGITQEQYQYLESLEGPGICHVHLGPERMKRNGKVIALGVEHAHDCDQGHDPKKGCSSCVRGLACYNCNGYIATVEATEPGSKLRDRFADYLARRPLLEPGAPAQPDLQAMAFQYEYEIYDFHWPADQQAKMDARAAAGWQVNTALPNSLELYVLWQRELPRVQLPPASETAAAAGVQPEFMHEAEDQAVQEPGPDQPES